MSEKHNRTPERHELAEVLTWDLTPLYASDELWEKDFASLDVLAAQCSAFKGRLAESPAVFRQALEAMDALDRLLEKLFTYAHLKHDENTLEPVARARENRVRSKAAELSGATAWFDPEVMSIDDKIMQKFLHTPELAFYRQSLEELLRTKPHTLSEPEERLLGEFADIHGNAGEIYETLTDADLTFPAITDERGKRVELTSGNYISFLESGDRRIRKSAFRKMYQTYEKIIHTCAATLDGTVREHVKSAKIRHYNSALQAALFDDELPESLYRNLIAAIHENIPTLADYLKLRKKLLHLRKLDMYDLFNPLFPMPTRRYTYEEAQTLVLDALQVMGEEYVAILRRAFRERWVDVPECRGKRSGAYSSGCYDSAPYLLLNYNGTLNDVFTLAHELGHSMHSYYSNHTQQYHYAGYSIFAAEIASTTNELLLHDHLMKLYRDQPELRQSLLVHLADEIRTTIYRQTMFAEFELLIHELVEQGTPLTAELLNRKYYELNNLYHGNVINADSFIQYEWARIPHFYYDFYVFKYATGMSAAMKFSQDILSGNPELKNRYFGFLKSGDSKPVLEILKDAGMDFSTPNVISEGMQSFRKVVDQLQTLC